MESFLHKACNIAMASSRVNMRCIWAKEGNDTLVEELGCMLGLASNVTCASSIEVRLSLRHEQGSNMVKLDLLRVYMFKEEHLVSSLGNEEHAERTYGINTMFKVLSVS